MANQRSSTEGTRGGTQGDRSDSRSNDKRGSLASGSEDEELVGETEEGIAVEGTLDDSEGLEASGSDTLDSDQSGTRGGRGKRGGSGNFANDPQRASEAGRKGGRH